MQGNNFAYTSFEANEVSILMLALIHALKMLNFVDGPDDAMGLNLADIIAGVGCRRKSFGGELASALDAQNVAYMAIAVFQDRQKAVLARSPLWTFPPGLTASEH